MSLNKIVVFNVSTHIFKDAYPGLADNIWSLPFICLILRLALVFLMGSPATRGMI